MKLILIDFENCPKSVVPNSLPEDIRVMVFVGSQNKTLPTLLSVAMSELREQGIFKVLHTSGKNALDFVICLELGRRAALQTDAEFILVSGDKGFDPMIEYASRCAIRVRRVDSMNEALRLFGVLSPADNSKEAKILEPRLQKKSPQQENPNLVGKAKATATIPSKSGTKPAPQQPAKTAAKQSAKVPHADPVTDPVKKRKALSEELSLSGPVKKVRERLQAMKHAKPKSLSGLETKIAEICGAKVGKPKIEAIIKRLETAKFLVVDDKKVRYLG